MTQFRLVYQSPHIDVKTEQPAYNWEAGLAAFGGGLSLAIHGRVLVGEALHAEETAPVCSFDSNYAL
jgi:hypothetical protein